MAWRAAEALVTADLREVWEEPDWSWLWLGYLHVDFQVFGCCDGKGIVEEALSTLEGPEEEEDHLKVIPISIVVKVLEEFELGAFYHVLSFLEG